MDRAGFPRQSARLRRVADVADYVGTQCFRAGPPGTVGVEVEWLTIDVREPHRRVHPQRCHWLGGPPRRRSRPGIDDLALRLTTLFPPIRPRGWLEFRMIDAQPAAYWAVPAAVVTALLDDPQAGELAHAVCEPVAGEWLTAARDGLAHSGLAIAAARCLDLTLQALPRLGNSAVTNTVRSFAEQYTWVGRCPADDLIGPSDAKRPPCTRRDDLREAMLLP